MFTLQKPNHARQDNLWLPLSNENSNAFLRRARLGFRPQTLDPLLTPGFLWAPASMEVERGHPAPGSPRPALLGCPGETEPAEDSGPLPKDDPNGAWGCHA